MSAYLHLGNKSHSRRISALIICTLILLALVRTGFAAPDQGILEVHFIDVGQGDSILVMTPDNRSMLVDAGDYRSGPIVVSYLRALGVMKIDVLVSTHPHSDHIGGMASVLASLPVSHVYDSGRLHTSKTYEEYLKAIDANNIPFSLARAGDTIPLANDVSVKVLWPDGPRKVLDFGDLNESSVILLVKYGNIEYLLTGDAGTETERTLLAGGKLGQVDILKVGHHGSRSSTSLELLEAIRPKIAVIMCGTDNPYGHPHDNVTKRLTAAKAKTLRTDLNGTIVISTDGESYTIGGVAEAAAGIETQVTPPALLIDVNTASAEELQQLPGIGETLARRIIEYRLEKGLITSLEMLLEVKGIGPATLAKIGHLITF